MNLTFLKTKKFIIPAVIVVIIGGLWYRSYRNSHQPVQYDTVTVQRGDLKQTVEATGKIESVNDISMRFELPGTVDRINVKAGDKVKAGAILATLRLAELNAAVAQAKANLDLKLAGATNEDINYYKAAADSAKASLDQARVDAANVVSTAQAALDTAQNNLKMAEGGENSQIVNDAYGDGVALVQTEMTVMDNSITQADNILGIDNTFANQDFRAYLASSNPSKLVNAQNYYYTAKTARDIARSASAQITIASSHADVDRALSLEQDALSKINQLLYLTSDVLSATSPVGTMTQTTLDAKKTIIESTRTSVSNGLTSVINQIQSLASAKNSYSTYIIAYNKAVNDLAVAQATGHNSITIKEAQYNQALANLQSKTIAPRSVDVASYRAALAQAVASRDKAIIKAPIDGIITKVNKKRGESISSAEVMVQMLMPHFEIKVDVPETDVPKLANSDATEITLDAFGDDVKFSGQVLNIEPGSTEIQDVVYYKVTVALNDTDKPIKSGMTANVTFNTDTRTDVLYVPLRAVRTNSTKYVRLLVNGQEKETPVKLGLKADDGKVEILEGLKEGDVVILGIKSNTP